jgi:hydrogenase-4 component F
MVWGTPPEGVPRGEAWDIGHVPLIVTSLALVGLGVMLPDQIKTLLDRAVGVLLMR